jgi:integrase
MKKRWLPKYVSQYTDRHGTIRYSFRRTGFPSHSFVNREIGSQAFLAEYNACLQAKAVAATHSADRIILGSFDDLCNRYYKSPKWRDQAATTKVTYSNIIERFRKQHGKKQVHQVTTAHIDAILGRMSNTPAAANNLRKMLNTLFGYAVKIGMRTDNPVLHTDKFKAGKGFHTWTDEEIEQFRAHHPIGTKPRLALELLLNTAARRGTVVALTRDNLRNGKFHVQHSKGCNATIVPALPETIKAIEAMPIAGMSHFLVTNFGKPFAVAGFGNWFREQCDAAGLKHCSAHGLRKAISRQLAESGASDSQGRSIAGHKKDATFRYYSEMANREGLAENAMYNLETHKLYNLPKKP